MAGRRARTPAALRQALGRLYERLADQRLHASKTAADKLVFVRRWSRVFDGKDSAESIRSDFDPLGFAQAFDFLLQNLPQKALQKRISLLATGFLEPQSPDRDSAPTSACDSPLRLCRFRDLDVDAVTTTTADLDLIFTLSPLCSNDDEELSAHFETYVPPADDLAFAEEDSAPCKVVIRMPRQRACRAQLDQVLTRLRRTTRNGEREEPPKKEYFRCQHIRALKKSIRQIESKKLPGTSIHRIQEGNEVQKELWNQLQDIFRHNVAQLSQLSSTHSGPVTDGKTKRSQSSSAQEKSFNNEFCRKFFSSSAIQEYNAVFCDLVYDVPPENLCAKLKLRCCTSQDHAQDCGELWSEVKRYAKTGMLEELEVPRVRMQSEEDVDLLADDR